jgi:hypothetical protein
MRAPSHAIHWVLRKRQLGEAIKRVDGDTLGEIEGRTLGLATKDTEGLISVIGKPKLDDDNGGVASRNERNSGGLGEWVICILIMGLSGGHQQSAFIEELSYTNTDLSFPINNQALHVLREAPGNRSFLRNDGDLDCKVIRVFKLCHEIVALVFCFQRWTFVNSNPQTVVDFVALLPTETTRLGFHFAVSKFFIVGYMGSLVLSSVIHTDFMSGSHSFTILGVRYRSKATPCRPGVK